MAASVMVKYKDLAREALHHPFSFQSVLYSHWHPIARKLGLPLIQRIDCLWISERVEADKFVQELLTVKQYLMQPGQEDEYMLTRIGELVPILESTIAEWDQVEGISI